jgi:hypothetical protein
LGTTDRPPPTRFAAELTARRWWYQRFSIEYRQTSRRELGEDLTLTEKQFKNWIHGRVKTRPQPKAAKILEVMFPPWTVTELLTAEISPPHNTQGQAESRPEDVRSLRSGIALTAPAPEDCDDHTYLDSVHAHIRRIIALDKDFGGTDLVPISLNFFRSLHSRLGAGSYDPRLKRDFYSAAGELAEVVGWLAYDANQHELVRKMNQESLFFTHLAGDRSMELLTLQNSSMHAGTLGHPGEALAIADSVLEGDRPLSPRLQALFLTRRARALAQAGDHSALRIFPQVRSLFLDGVVDGDPAWVEWIDERELAWHEAMAHRDLGHGASALLKLEHSVAVTPSTRARSQYERRTYLLQSQVDMRAWREAESTMGQLQTLAADVASARTDAVLHEVVTRIETGEHDPAPPRFIDDQIVQLKEILG